MKKHKQSKIAATLSSISIQRVIIALFLVVFLVLTILYTSFRIYIADSNRRESLIKDLSVQLDEKDSVKAETNGIRWFNALENSDYDDLFGKDGAEGSTEYNLRRNRYLDLFPKIEPYIGLDWEVKDFRLPGSAGGSNYYIMTGQATSKEGKQVLITINSTTWSEYDPENISISSIEVTN